MKCVTITKGKAPAGQAVSTVSVGGGDGTLLGALPKVEGKPTTAQLQAAYNALVDALVAAGLAEEGAE
jgi:hypothetical protein|nr:MAG TPA: diacylgycerol kinase [Caudoviricetes sp.]